MIASIIWLGLLAQGLLYCLDILGNMLGISDELMGLTIGAWGASMPTLWSSLVVAKKGFGDMALSNAIGANVFSVLVGLGLPWFSYPLYLNGPYNGIQDSGIRNFWSRGSAPFADLFRIQVCGGLSGTGRVVILLIGFLFDLS